MYMKRIGILVFDGVEDLAVIGPARVFAAAARLGADCLASTISDHSPVICRLGTRLHVALRIDAAPPQDLLFVPAGVPFSHRRYLRLPHRRVVQVAGATAIEIAQRWVERLWGARVGRAVRIAMEPPRRVPSGVRGLF